MKKWQWLMAAGLMAVSVSLVGCKPAATPEALCDKTLAEMKVAVDGQKDAKIKEAMGKALEGLEKEKSKCVDELKKKSEKDKDFVKRIMDACKDKKGEEFMKCAGDAEEMARDAKKEESKSEK